MLLIAEQLSTPHRPKNSTGRIFHPLKPTTVSVCKITFTVPVKYDADVLISVCHVLEVQLLANSLDKEEKPQTQLGISFIYVKDDAYIYS